MTASRTPDERGSRGARDWARFQEPHFRSNYDTVHERLKIGNGTRLLDVGCGSGGAALLASERGARVAGLDAAPDAIEVARERVPEGDFRVGDMGHLPWPDHAFDAVTSFNAFQFARNPTATLAEAARVLAPGGKVGMVIWAPREVSQQAGIMEAIGALAPPQPPDAPGPFALSSIGVAESVLAAAGLRLVESGEVPIVAVYPDAEAACRALMRGSAGIRAVQHCGEARVRQVILEVLAPFQVETGGYRIENRFRYLIAV
jgi:SAM-dependent methyltransferase